MPIRGRSRRHRSLRCCCSAIQCTSRSLIDVSSTVCMPIGVSKVTESLPPGISHMTGLQSTHERARVSTLFAYVRSASSSASFTAGSSHNTRTNVPDNRTKNPRFSAELLGDNDRIFSSQQPHLDSAVDFLRKLGHCHSEIRLVYDALQILYLVHLFL